MANIAFEMPGRSVNRVRERSGSQCKVSKDKTYSPYKHTLTDLRNTMCDATGVFILCRGMVICLKRECEHQRTEHNAGQEQDRK